MRDRTRRELFRLAAAAGAGSMLAGPLARELFAAETEEYDDGSNESGSQPTPSQNGPGPAPEGDTAKLSPIGGGRGEGTVAVTDEGATITIRGLPNPAPGSYQVWLYNSIVDAKSLGTFPTGSGKLDVDLPSDASNYQFLDVSREPDDANPNHSGASVMRAPLGDLLSE